MGTSSSRGIDIIEIHGLFGSIRTSSISFEWGRTGVVVVWLRWSLPTSRIVCASPNPAGASTPEDSLIALWKWRSLAMVLISPLINTTVAPALSATTRTQPSRIRQILGRRPGLGGGSAGGIVRAA